MMNYNGDTIDNWTDLSLAGGISLRELERIADFWRGIRQLCVGTDSQLALFNLYCAKITQ